jgi:hypothetical protein
MNLPTVSTVADVADHSKTAGDTCICLCTHPEDVRRILGAFCRVDANVSVPARIEQLNPSLSHSSYSH